MFTPETTCLCCFQELHEPKGVCPYCGCNNATISNEAHQLEAGSILAGTYLIGKVLGQGGFGITYVGWDLNLEIKVAIKEYYPEGCVTRDTHTHVTVLTYAGTKDVFFQKGKERFVGEARSLAKFSGDSGVVGVRAFFYENGTAYIVMDFVDGETLKAYAARVGGRMPASQVLSLFQPLIRSLARVHESGLLHRDISPDNIMLKPDGTLALLDFGAARQISVAGEHSNTINVKHGFAPEEQYRTRGEQGPWTDVYALCATIYRLTTGVTPTEALDRMANDEPLAPPSAYGADFTPMQEAAVMHGLALRANARTRDLRQLSQELYAVSAPVANTVTEPAPAMTPVPVAPAQEYRTFEQPKSVPQQEYSVTVPVFEAAPQTMPASAGVEQQAPLEEPRSVQAEVQSVSTTVEGEQKNAASDKKDNKIRLIFGILAAVVLVALIAVVSSISNNSEMPGATEEPQMTLAPGPVVQEDPSTPIDWQDPIIEAGIRSALGKTSGEVITVGDLDNITDMTIAGDHVIINDQSFWPYVDKVGNSYSVDGAQTMLPIPEQTITLKDLKNFQNLSSLNLAATSVADWDTLRMCPYLNVLTLNACGDVDLNWFSGIQTLQYLNVSSCDRLTVLGGEQGATYQSLSLGSSGPLNCTELAAYENLTDLSIFDCMLITPEDLGTMNNLISFGLSSTQVSNVDFVTQLRNLQSLNLSESMLSRFPLLSRLPELTALYMYNQNLSDDDIFQISQLKNLTQLSIDECNVSDLQFVRNLADLNYLSINYTSVKDVSPLRNLKNLNSIWMMGTKVTDISVFSELNFLETLAINSTKIKDFSPLAGLPLKTFFVDATQEAKIREMFPNADITVW